MENFKWLITKRNTAGEDEIYCKICNAMLKVSAGRADLLKHENTKKHKEKSNCLNSSQTTIDKQFQDKTGELKLKCVQTLEIQLSAFIVEHNLPFSCMDHLSKFLKTSIPDSKITPQISCGRTKTTCLVKNVLGRTQFDYVCNILRQQKFSLCIDESTDIANIKSLCLVVRVTFNSSVKDYFFGLIEVDKCDANSIFMCIVNYFK